MAVNLSPVGGVAAQFFTNSGVILSGGKLITYAAGTTTPAVTYTSVNGSTAHTNPIVLNSAGRVPSSGEIWLTDGISYKFVLTDANDVLIATYDNIVGINSNFVNYTNEQEIQTATASQTVFTLTTMQYQVGTGSLSVFVDGVNQYGPSAQYAFVETSSTVVTFTNGLHVGASVKFTTSAINASSYGDASQISYTPAGTGAVTTNVQAKLRQYVSVLDFGADPTGATNSTTKIQAAIDAVASVGGGTVYINPGNYSVSQLVWKNTVSIFGAGNTSKLIANGDPPDGGVFVSTAGPVTNCYLRDFYIDCTAQASGGNGLYLSSLTRCEISGLYIYNARAFGSLVFKSVNCKYLRNTIDTTRQWDGMTISGSGVNQSVNNLIEGNIVLNSYDSGIGFTASQGTVCVGNLVDRRAVLVAGSYYAPGIDASGCQNSVITGNYVIGNQFGISLLQHPNSGYNPFRVTCTGNTVCNSLYGIMLGAVAVIPPAVTTYTLNEIILSGNKIVEASVQGIHIDTATYITVSGNDVSYCGNGIFVTGASQIILNGNTINRSAAYGINISTGVTYVTFINNVSIGNATGDYTGAPGAGSTASGNINSNGQETFYSSVYGNNLFGNYTVATLPSGTVGARAFVTDATSPVFGNAVVGGGSTRIPVFYNSLNWVVG